MTTTNPKPLFWTRLDNAAKIYPAARRKNWSNVFRQSVTLYEEIDVSASAILLYYLKKGKLCVWGGTFIVFGAFMLFLEFLLSTAFGIGFSGWSVYPLTALAAVGCLFIYIAINSSVREMMERKLFF